MSRFFGPEKKFSIFVDRIRFPRKVAPLPVSNATNQPTTTTMSLALPTNPALRETFDIQSIVNWQSLPSYRVAVSSLRNTVSQHGVSGASAVCFRANGEVHLISCGKRGGIKTLWNFGDPIKTGR